MRPISANVPSKILTHLTVITSFKKDLSVLFAPQHGHFLLPLVAM